ncbi:MAG: DUF6164 family protein [Gammaproteobacteria bacterium]
MAVLIFKLRYVPDDEAHEVRELLSDNDIDFYETSAGVLGISMPGLWLKNEAQLQKARQLIDEYQQRRQVKAREEYEQGTARTFLDMFKEAPVRYISFILAIILICYLMIFAFFNL